MLPEFAYFQTIEYTAHNQGVYQQDIVIHRTHGQNYEETDVVSGIWHVYVGENCKSDYGDLRFTDSAGLELAYYLWSDFSAESARFCVRLLLNGEAGSGNVCIWYGNINAVTTSDGNATFFIFDDFESGTVPNQNTWTMQDGNTPLIVDGKLQIGRGTRHLVSINSIGASEIWMQCEYIVTDRASNDGYSMCGLSLTPPFSNIFTGMIFFDDGRYDRTVMRNGVHTWWSSSLPGRGVTINAHRISVGVAADRIVHKSEGYYSFVETNLGNTDILPTYNLNVHSADWKGGGWGLMSWVLVRAYNASPPTVTVFSGEQESEKLKIRGIGVTLSTPYII